MPINDDANARGGDRHARGVGPDPRVHNDLVRSVFDTYIDSLIAQNAMRLGGELPPNPLDTQSVPWTEAGPPVTIDRHAHDAAGPPTGEDTHTLEGDPKSKYVEEGTEGMWEDRGKRADEAEAESRKETGFTGHIGANESWGLGRDAGNAAGRARQEAGAKTPAEENAEEAEFQRTRTDDPLKDKGSFRGHIGINEYLGIGTPEGNRIAAERQARGRPVDETDEI